jgi:hypothetical protein
MILADRVCDMRADTGNCDCATGCAAKQIDEMRESRDRAERESKRLLAGIQKIRNTLLYQVMDDYDARLEVLRIGLALVEGMEP